MILGTVKGDVNTHILRMYIMSPHNSPKHHLILWFLFIDLKEVQEGLGLCVCGVCAQLSICCLEKQFSVYRGIWGSFCPLPNAFPQEAKKGEIICRSLKPMQAGGSGDGGCWDLERKEEMARVGGLQRGGRVHRGWR